MNTLITLIAIAVLVAVFLSMGITMIPQRRAQVIERLGKYHRTLEPGLNLIIPFIDRPRAITILTFKNDQPVVRTEDKIDMREVVLDFPSQSVITQDNVGVQIDGVLYYQIMDPQAAVYGTENLVLAIQTLAQTSLRSEIGTMELDKIFESRQEINARLQTVMDEAGNKWGLKVNRVEIRDIDTPQEIREAMNQQMVAERNRRATVREAEGYKEAEIQKAEGDKQAEIAKAEGQKQAAILVAQGEKEAIQNVMAALEGKADDPMAGVQYLIAQRYIEMLPELAKQGDRVFVPMEGTALLGSLGGMRDLFGAGAMSSVDSPAAPVTGSPTQGS
ncbi:MULTISPECIES: SPFH domain-containing protein [Thioalkalivibrio]|uniref:Paraslipin n=1 Tax=Thioalkalivibrio halophilus TaxID=252474 RepID=A0A1V3A0H9_9GAMM|nr:MULTISPECIES: SPFH domain-containing protein [Thioalkalivibrio]OOC10852.1 paraslipin [Thioalkalivibrio halophilus]PYG03896.1 SPFH domain-containing protein [Thioalkalivibrio sp. ALE21]